ncbi:unnamed protein product [Cylicocyclus nassatus]|uniref:Uncharacterized protein n=1 Tax=Cylicocyclus nassatus TaxID=53992 RepID=A0AA36HAS0_CYLNA|nr:unnamed protein product [Cylicocyclus nassatus]
MSRFKRSRHMPLLNKLVGDERRQLNQSSVTKGRMRSRQLNELTVKARRVHHQGEFHDKHSTRREKQSQPMDKSAYGRGRMPAKEISSITTSYGAQYLQTALELSGYAMTFHPHGSHPYYMAYGSSESQFTCEINDSPPCVSPRMDHCRKLREKFGILLLYPC